MKKINSEIKIDTPLLKTKWGTIDKKNPTSIYLEMGTYITPTKDEEDYTDNIKEIEKAGRFIVKDALCNTEGVKKDFIFVTDIADTRISYGKKSYISFQIHLGRPRKDGDKQTFKEIVNNIDSKWKPVYSSIVKTIENNGFSCSKTKS